MKNGIEFFFKETGNNFSIGYISLYKYGSGIDISFLTGRKVVKNSHRTSFRDKPVNYMTSNKTSSSGD